MKKMKFWNYASKFLTLSLVGSMLVFTACKEEEPTPPAGDPIATFTFEISAENYLSVTFNSDAAQNAASYAWNFGDDNVSTEANPTHVYDAEGDYTVSLVVTNADGVESNNFTADITIADPDAVLKLLTGEVSKDWKLYREGVALEVGPNEAAPAGWFAGENNGTRPCIYDDTWTFNFDGTMEFDDGNSMWGEYGIWGINAGENALFETCFEPTAANMTINGNDVSAWGSGTFMFEYAVADGNLILNGEGAWIVVPNLGTDANHAVDAFPMSKTVPISIEEFDGYDLMTVTFDHGDAGAGGQGFRRATYVSYDDWNDEPDLVADVPACVPNTAVSPTIISHSFASNEADQWNLMQPIESGSGLNLGVDDPTDAAAAKVGEFVRTAAQYQELQFKLDPVADNTPINFENLTTITMDVYLPSTNVYTGGLNQNVFVGFGATNCPPDWFTDNTEYQATEVALDTWTTLTFTITEPDYVATPDSGANPTLRNDFDMIYISIGGNNHTDTGSFFMRNFKIE